MSGYKVAWCERCDWRFLLHKDAQAKTCPHCFRAPLVIAQQDENRGSGPGIPVPELCLPFSFPEAELKIKLSAFSRSIWFAPADLTLSNLTARLQNLYLPAWLVDTSVSATWQAEVGFHYQVLSHEERYDQRSGWLTQEKKETRVRWESRLGKLARIYQNILAPALEEQPALDRQLGAYDRKLEEPFPVEAKDGCCIALPDRPAQDAWGDAALAVQALGAEDCRKAAQGDQIRNFRWSADYSDQHWTLFLKPVFATYYLDDEQRPQPVLVNAQSGKLSGMLKASMRRAQRASQRILIVAVVIFLLSLLLSLGALVLPIMLGFGIFGLTLAAAVGLMAVIPIAMAWQVNRKKD